MKKLLFALALGLPLPTFATSVLFDFEGLGDPQTPFYGNMVINGARFSPNCHAHIVAPPYSRNSTWMGFDASGCMFDFNTEFLGPDEYRADAVFPLSLIWVDLFGRTFDVESVWLSNAEIVSSKGGRFFMPMGTDDDAVAITGDEWRGVEWIMFINDSAGDPVGFDDLTLSFASVSEPAGLMLLGTAMYLLALTRPKRP